jgi:HAD superfamily hydrolase (TIGR01509 family)
MSAPGTARGRDDARGEDTLDGHENAWWGDELGAVLFDMDGTLVDSERLWSVSMDRVAGHLGGTVSESVKAATTGASIPHSVGLLLDDLGSDRGIEETTSLLLEITAEIFAEDLLWQPGAQELIDSIRDAGIKTALVTNSPRSLVDVALGGLLGEHRFDVTVCGDEVDQGKPTPGPYLRAMDLLQLTAADCLAVEDSPSGTRAAVAAGIAVLVVPSEVPVPEGPGRIFASSLLGATVDELRHIHREFRRSIHRTG